MRETSSRDGFALGEVELIDDVARVPLVVPINGKTARWYVATLVSLAPLAERLDGLVRDRFAGRFDAVTVIDANLRFIIHVDPEQRLSPARQLDALAGIDAAAIRAGILVYRDVESDRGGGTLAVIRSLPGLPWAVVAQIPRDQVYGPVYRARRLVIIAVVLTALLALVAAILLSRRAAAPIRTLVQMADDLGRRKFDRRVEVHTGDELETLATAMTSAASRNSTRERSRRNRSSSGAISRNRPNSRNRTFFTRARARFIPSITICGA